MEYAFAALALAGLGFLVWFGIRERKAGGDAIAAQVAEKTADNLRAQDKAGAEAAGEPVVDRLRRGEF